MHNKQLYSLLFVLILFLLSCSGSKKYAKQASKFEAAGLYKEASKKYLESIKRDPNNIDARLGLEKTGEKVFQDYLNVFFTAKATGETKKAVYAYLDARKYASLLGTYNIKLEEPTYLKEDFKVLKAEYLEEQYSKGKALMGKEDFEEAERIFHEVLTIEPDYKDAAILKNVAYMEPYYAKAIKSYSEEKYVNAYYLLEKVVAKDPNYKDSKEIIDECLTLGTYTIALVGIDNVSGNNVAGHKVQATLLTALTNNNNPFIRIIDRENMESILEQQRLNLSGAIDEKTAASVGELLGAKAVISGKVIERKLSTGATKTFTRNGYQAYSVKQLNSNTQEEEYVTKYNKVNYKEYYQLNEVKLSYQVQVTSLETGEIIFSKVIDEKKSDVMHFALYEGDKKKLYPENKGQLSLDRNNKKKLDALLGAKRELKASTELFSELLSNSANSVSDDIINTVDRYISK